MEPTHPVPRRSRRNPWIWAFRLGFRLAMAYPEAEPAAECQPETVWLTCDEPAHSLTPAE